MSANHILENFLFAENFPEWKWAGYRMVPDSSLPDINPIPDTVGGTWTAIRH